MARKLEHMVAHFGLKGIDEATGHFSGYASVFGNVDLGGDVVMPGAFKRTLEHTKGEVPILSMHDPTKPVGLGSAASEDGKGLFVEGDLDMDTQGGRETYSGLKKGYISDMSIGFKVIAKEHKDGVRYLKEVALPEYSLLTKGFAMNPEATIVEVKADFNAALQEAIAEQDLHERRWQINSALSDVMDEIEDDDLLTGAQKVEALRASLLQYTDALCTWFTEFDALEASESEEGDDMGMGTMSALSVLSHTLEHKAGAVLSTASLAKVKAAIDALTALMDSAMPKESGKSAPVTDSQDALGDGPHGMTPDEVKTALAEMDVLLAGVAD
jgi:HK97 family phage prohead protease